MKESDWIQRCISYHRKRFERIEKMINGYKYDDDYVKKCKEESVILGKELQVLEKQIPEQKIHEYGGAYKCLRCGCVVNQFAKYCHYCGQRFALKSDEEYQGIEGWCADK